MFLILFFNIFVYCFSFLILQNLGGLKKNLPFAFSLFIFVIYYFITPTYFYFAGRKTIWGDEEVYNNVGVDISDYYGTVLFYYGIANLFFALGYLIPKSNNLVVKKAKYLSKVVLINGGATAVSIFTILFLLILANFAVSGFSLVGLLKGDDSQAIGGLPGFSNFIKNFADSLIIILVIAFHFDVNRIKFIVMTFLSFVLFGLLYFRYRIILTLLGFAFSSIYKTKRKKINFMKFALFGVFFSYFILFFTFNRNTLLKADWNEISFSPSDFEYDIIFEQTRGMLDDINVIKYYEQINPDEKYDYGSTYLYIFVRILPRSIVGDDFKNNLYPPFSFKVIERAYNLPSNWNGISGEAPLHLAYNYIAGGLWGLFIISFLTGICMRLFQNRYPPLNDYYIFINIGVALALFQWYTRGYFPGFVDHLTFIIAGCWLFKKFAVTKV